MTRSKIAIYLLSIVCLITAFYMGFLWRVGENDIVINPEKTYCTTQPLDGWTRYQTDSPMKKEKQRALTLQCVDESRLRIKRFHLNEWWSRNSVSCGEYQKPEFPPIKTVSV